MSVSVRPSWLLKPEALRQALIHNLSVPEDIDAFTSLEDSTGLVQGVRQFLFWRSQLLSSLTPHTIFLAFLGPKGLVHPNIVNVYRGLQVLCDMSQLLEVQTGANSNFLALSFSSAVDVNRIQEQYLFSEDCMVLHIAGDMDVTHRFRLLWLPPMFSVDRVHQLLRSFSVSHCLRRESIGVGGGVSSPTNVISGTLTLAAGKSIDNLPYLIRLPAPHKGCALLSIASRQPICLKCQALGHVRGQCPMIKCSSCGKVHFPDAPCGVSSYSSVASRNVSTFSTDAWLESLPDVPVPAVVGILDHVVDAKSSATCSNGTLASVPICDVHSEFHLVSNLPPDSPSAMDVSSVGMEWGHTLSVSSVPASPIAASSAVASSGVVTSASFHQPSIGGDVVFPISVAGTSRSSLLAGIFAAAADGSLSSVDMSPSPALKRKSSPDILIDSSNLDVPPGARRSRSLKRRVRSGPGVLSSCRSASKSDRILRSSSLLVHKSPDGVGGDPLLPSQPLPGDGRSSSEGSLTSSVSSRVADKCTSVHSFLLLEGFPCDLTNGELDCYMDAHSFVCMSLRDVVITPGDATHAYILVYDDVAAAEADLHIGLSAYNQFPISVSLVHDISCFDLV